MTKLFEFIGKRVTAVPAPVVKYGAAGALAGGAVSAVKNCHKVMKKEIEVTEAVSDTFKQSLGTGIASAIGMSVITIVGLEGILATAGIMVVAGLAKEGLDTVTQPRIESDETLITDK